MRFANSGCLFHTSYSVNCMMKLKAFGKKTWCTLYNNMNVFYTSVIAYVLYLTAYSAFFLFVSNFVSEPF